MPGARSSARNKGYLLSRRDRERDKEKRNTSERERAEGVVNSMGLTAAERERETAPPCVGAGHGDS